MKYIIWGLFWVSLYLCVILAPQFVLLIGTTPAGNGFWWDFSISLGFAGAAMLGMMFFLTARFRRATAPFGIDLIYYFHRYISLIAFLVILSHPAILLALDPGLFGTLIPKTENWHMISGAGSIGILAFLLWILPPWKRVDNESH